MQKESSHHTHGDFTVDVVDLSDSEPEADGHVAPQPPLVSNIKVEPSLDALAPEGQMDVSAKHEKGRLLASTMPRKKIKLEPAARARTENHFAIANDTAATLSITGAPEPLTHIPPGSWDPASCQNLPPGSQQPAAQPSEGMHSTAGSPNPGLLQLPAAGLPSGRTQDVLRPLSGSMNRKQFWHAGDYQPKEKADHQIQGDTCLALPDLKPRG